jgi:hypothetical protein
MRKLTLTIFISLFVFNFAFGQDTESKLDQSLITILDTVFQDDQMYRQKSREIEEKYGWDSEERQAHGRIIKQKDSINLIKVRKILDERGWLGSNVIGKQGNMTLYLVIQHSNSETREKYLPMMREAVQNRNASPSSLALLEDRVALGKGEKQIYGSQIAGNSESGYIVQPLIDPDNVDKRRAEVGLGSLQDYVSRWGIIWDVEEFKKKQQENENKE